jgi:hypothetical protein
MNASKIEQEVLSAAVEDYAGLWEILWQLNNEFPRARPSENRRVATRAIVSLVDRGLVALYLGTDFPSGARQIPSDEVGQVLNADANWSEPSPHAEQVRLAATDAGEKELYGTGRRS